MKIICNPTTYGGKAKGRWPKYEKALNEAGFEYEIEWTTEQNHAIEIARKASDDHDLIVSYGGDGTVNEIVTGIAQAGYKSTLAILPAGRGNDSAYNIRQTKNIEDLVEMLHLKKHRVIDCIKVNDGDRYSMSVGGAGLDADVSVQVANKKTRIIYNIALYNSFFRYRPRHMLIDIDDGKEVFDIKSLTTMVGNGQRVGDGLLVTPDAVIDDGILDIMIVGDTTILESLIVSTRLKKGTHLTHPKIDIYQGKRVSIESKDDKKVYGHVMGEYLGELPYTFEVEHKVLKILKMSDAVIEREGWQNANAFSENVK
ncbi:MAG: diacylglycerol/lipid kinase family protein [Candidatus Heimdallarchaeota archaeon]